MTPEELRAPRMPRLPGESADDYIDRILLAVGGKTGRRYLSPGHPLKTEPEHRMPIEYALRSDELFPEVAMPPEPGMFQK